MAADRAGQMQFAVRWPEYETGKTILFTIPPCPVDAVRSTGTTPTLNERSGERNAGEEFYRKLAACAKGVELSRVGFGFCGPQQQGEGDKQCRRDCAVPKDVDIGEQRSLTRDQLPDPADRLLLRFDHR